MVLVAAMAEMDMLTLLQETLSLVVAVDLEHLAVALEAQVEAVMEI